VSSGGGTSSRVVAVAAAGGGFVNILLTASGGVVGGQHSSRVVADFCKHCSGSICYVRGAVPPVPPLPCSAVGCPCVTLDSGAAPVLRGGAVPLAALRGEVQ
jgi:hypothetical protein